MRLKLWTPQGNHIFNPGRARRSRARSGSHSSVREERSDERSVCVGDKIMDQGEWRNRGMSYSFLAITLRLSAMLAMSSNGIIGIQSPRCSIDLDSFSIETVSSMTALCARALWFAGLTCSITLNDSIYLIPKPNSIIWWYFLYQFTTWFMIYIRVFITYISVNTSLLRWWSA